MADDGDALAALRPVAARLVIAARKCRPVGLRSGQDVVLVRRVAPPIDYVALLRYRGLLVQIVGGVKLRHVFRDSDAFGVLPGAVADTVARIDGLRSLRAEVSVPRPATGTGPGR